MDRPDSQRKTSFDESGWLTVDRGNSTLDCMWAGTSGHRARLEPTVEAFAEFVGGHRPVRIAAASVVSGPDDGLDAIREYLRAAPGLAGVRIERAGDDLPCPLELVYDTPETLGVDRWLAATGAWRRFGAALVVDVGTAATVDAVTGDGRFLGGAIAPGVRSMAAGLAARAPGLPEVAWSESGAPIELPPRTSQTAVEAGVVLGFVGAVEGLVERIRRAVDFSADTPIVLTGGDAELLVLHGELEYRVVPDLVHAGLRCLLHGCPHSNS